ncbi:MAG: citrate lyase holo-[acyl-carrier protein] synthase [Pyramidobacter sp.]|nr:citrate lyase holo-[acyl-carrier protein] synthase [Pyramidobacter sp.]
MNIQKLCGGNKITLVEMLDARERRVGRQQEMLAAGGASLVCFTLNMPGEVKCFPIAQKFFERGLDRLKRHLKRSGAGILQEKKYIEKTGCEAFLLTDTDALTVKKLAVQLEESSEASRLYDMDVLSADGVKVSRSSLGLPGRTCIVCGRPAMDCAPRRAHLAEELARRAVSLMASDVRGAFADDVSAAAQRALLCEVCVSPKPGLVDRFNNGSHTDMDLFTFVSSACALAPYFRRCVLTGIEMSDERADALFERMRVLGMEAEEDMLAATGGVNAHKGAIFSAGVLCGARGWLWGRGETAETPKLLDAVTQILVRLKDDFGAQPDTAGGKIYRSTGISGIRGEAAAGFPSAGRLGLPLLELLLSKGCPFNDAGAITLVHLMACVDDTNMIKRSSHGRYEEIKSQIQELVSRDPAPSMETLASLDKDFIAENLSPGGSADMLALSFMLHFFSAFSSETCPRAE